ncbi:trehalase-like domain-containing protein [Streptomyces sp. NPDC014006]|uniref:trehalase-like domain-containing protein n=1 Tax=Streptomyces sp. NPDC014006 TaxID=3364870 RepID=UPI0036FD7A8D
MAGHGLVGDLQTVALVSSEGVVDRRCAPRSDSSGIFGALLDHDRGGHFAITVEGPDVTTRQLHFPDTAILVTRFPHPGGGRRGRRPHAPGPPADPELPAPVHPGDAGAARTDPVPPDLPPSLGLRPRAAPPATPRGRRPFRGSRYGRPPPAGGRRTPGTGR